MMFRMLSLLTLLFSLGACVSIPSTSTGLVSEAGLKKVYCYDQDKQSVSQSIDRYMDTCWKTETRKKFGWKVLKETLPGDGQRFSLNNAIGYGYVADVNNGSGSCAATQVNLYVLNGSWRHSIKATNSVINGKEFKCF